MSVIWVGGEDVDFSVGTGLPGTDTSGGRFRSAFARCCIAAPVNGFNQSVPFQGGGITSGWLSFYAFPINADLSTLLLGMVSSSTTSSGIWVGVSTSSATKLALFKFDGTTKTQLAAESGNSFAASVLVKIDMQFISLGTGASTVNVYMGGVLLITYSGSTTLSGISTFDVVGLQAATGTLNVTRISEVLVATTDTRGIVGVYTLALTGAGTTDQWSGVFSTINGTAISDASPNFTNTNAQDQQFNITDLAGGPFVIPAIKIAARMATGAGSAVSKVSLGYNNGGSVGFGTGAQKTPTGAYATYEQLDVIDPTTSAAWVQASINSLQFDLRSAT